MTEYCTHCAHCQKEMARFMKPLTEHAEMLACDGREEQAIAFLKPFLNYREWHNTKHYIRWVTKNYHWITGEKPYFAPLG